MMTAHQALAVLPEEKDVILNPASSRVKDLARSATNFRDAHASA
jgi:hypothetical protein